MCIAVDSGSCTGIFSVWLELCKESSAWEDRTPVSTVQLGLFRRGAVSWDSGMQ